MAIDKKYLIALFPLIVLVIFLVFFLDIVAYVAIAWVVSMIGAPIMRFFMRFKYIGKNLAAGLTLLSFVLIFFLIVSTLIPPLLQQARNLAGVDYEEVISNLEEPINDWNQWLIKRGLMEPVDSSLVMGSNDQKKADNLVTKVIRLDSLIQPSDSLSNNPEIAVVIQIDNSMLDGSSQETPNLDVSKSFFDKVKENVYQFLNPSVIPALFSTIVGFFSNFMIALLSVFFVAFFFLREQGLFGKIVAAIVPNKYESQGVHALDEAATLLIRYFLGVTIQIIIITLFVTLALTLLGVKNALLIGFFAALMNVIPYLGPLLGATFAVIITISSNLDVESFYSVLLPLILKVLSVFAIMQLLDNFTLQPFIFGKSVKAHPLEIFIVVLMGAKIGGILGMVLAIPMYTILRVVARVFMSEFKIVQQITKNL